MPASRIGMSNELDRRKRTRGSLLAEISCLLAAAFLLGLHYVHLAADFPNHSPWMDWSKYTDEGWYGDAAIRHFQLGHWNVPGDFNPGAALPVWPMVELALFRFTGVNLVAARALSVTIFALILLCSYALLRLWQKRTPNLADQAAGPAPLSPSVAVLLLAASPFCFVFTRMAILEPMLILLNLIALLVASYSGKPRLVKPGQPALRARLMQFLPPVVLGLLLTAMVLTKTTALFLFPAVFYLLFASSGYRPRPFLRRALPAVAMAALAWTAYFAIFVRPHFLADYRYLFAANGYTGITPENAATVLVQTVADGMWIGPILFPTALVAIAIAIFAAHRILPNPLILTLMLWAGGYTAFLSYHNNLQPRYYLVVAVPLTLLVPLVFEQLWLSYRRPTSYQTRPARIRLSLALALAPVLVLAAVVAKDARRTLHYVRFPDYTFVNAVQQLNATIRAGEIEDPGHNPLLLSISGSDISLITGLHSICDDFGTAELADRVRQYRPGWYAAWNQIDDDKMDALTPLFHIERVAAFPAYDDPDRNLLILYRLDPSPSTTPHPRRRVPTPKRLLTKLGQQPSTSQLQH